MWAALLLNSGAIAGVLHFLRISSLGGNTSNTAGFDELSQVIGTDLGRSLLSLPYHQELEPVVFGEQAICSSNSFTGSQPAL